MLELCRCPNIYGPDCISPHVFTPKEDQEGWTNGRFPHTKLKLCHKGVLLQNLKGPPIRRSTVFQILIELATTGRSELFNLSAAFL